MDIPNWNTNKHFIMDIHNSFMDISNSWISIIGLWISITSRAYSLFALNKLSCDCKLRSGCSNDWVGWFFLLGHNQEMAMSAVFRDIFRQDYTERDVDLSWSSTILILSRIIFIQENMVPFHWHVFWLYWLSKYRHNIHIITSYI